MKDNLDDTTEKSFQGVVWHLAEAMSEDPRRFSQRHGIEHQNCSGLLRYSPLIKFVSTSNIKALSSHVNIQHTAHHEKRKHIFISQTLCRIQTDICITNRELFVHFAQHKINFFTSTEHDSLCMFSAEFGLLLRSCLAQHVYQQFWWTLIVQHSLWIENWIRFSSQSVCWKLMGRRHVHQRNFFAKTKFMFSLFHEVLVVSSNQPFFVSLTGRYFETFPHFSTNQRNFIKKNFDDFFSAKIFHEF